MGIFKKKEETRPDELPVAGCGSLTQEQYSRICDELFMEVEHDNANEKFFNYGFLAALAFVSCPEGEDMTGTDALTFAQNAYEGAYQSELEINMQVRLAESAKSVLEQFGIKGEVRVDEADEEHDCGDE